MTIKSMRAMAILFFLLLLAGPGAHGEGMAPGAIARVNTHTILYDAPASQGASQALGQCAPGMLVRVLEKEGDWYHVYFSMVNGYLEANALTDTGHSAPQLPTHGYAVLGPPLEGAQQHTYDVDGFAATVDFPLEDAQQTRDVTVGSSFALIADVGDMSQVSHYAYSGFVRGELLHKYWLEDLLAGPDVSYAPGAYRVGQGLSSGLYVFETAKHLTGSIAWQVPGNPYPNVYLLHGPAAYTLYLPPNASVQIHGEGTLRKATADTFAFVPSQPFAGTMRLLVGEQVDAYPSTCYEIRLAEGAATGHYRLSTFLQDEGILAPSAPVALAPGEVHELPLGQGQFVEMVDCALVAKRVGG